MNQDSRGKFGEIKMSPKQKVGMTIAVEENEHNSFDFSDLYMYHQECNGGIVHVYNQSLGYEPRTAFSCGRCKRKRGLENEDDITGIVNTAINGTEYRTISHEGDDLVFIKTQIHEETVKKLAKKKVDESKSWWQFWRR